MAYLDLCGALALGIFIGFIIRFFIERFEEFTPKTASAIIGVALGGVAAEAVFKFGQDHGFAVYTIGLVLGLILYQLLTSKFPGLPMRRASTGPFIALEVFNSLTLLDTTGAEAVWMRRQKMKFNRDDVDEVLITQITQDGNPSEAVLDTRPRVAQLRQQNRAGQTFYYAKFAKPIKKAEIVELTFTLKLHDAFKDSNESFEHHVVQETEKLIFDIQFAVLRPCKAIELTRIFGPQASPVRVVQPRQAIREEINSGIKLEESYKVEWNW